MSGFLIEFEFEIGELVYFRAAQHAAGSRPKPFCVVGRLAEECAGGIQKHYKLDGREGFTLEIALCKEEPAYRPYPDAWYAEREQIIVAERDADRKAWESHHKRVAAERSDRAAEE